MSLLDFFKVQIFPVWTFSIGCFSFNVSCSVGLSDFHLAGGLYLDPQGMKRLPRMAPAQCFPL